MEGALLVIPLLGLTLPISMLIAALFFDAIVALWAVYHNSHDRHVHKHV